MSNFRFLSDAEDDTAPGPWWRPLVGWQDGKKRAWIKMPCGHTGTLGLGHTVNEAGVVQPSVVCPHKDPSGAACPFHEHIRLLDWVP